MTRSFAQPPDLPSPFAERAGTHLSLCAWRCRSNVRCGPSAASTLACPAEYTCTRVTGASRRSCTHPRALVERASDTAVGNERVDGGRGQGALRRRGGRAVGRASRPPRDLSLIHI